MVSIDWLCLLLLEVVVTLEALLLLLCPAFVIGSSRGSGLRGQVRVMRPNGVMVGPPTVLENVVAVLEGEEVSEGEG